MVEYIERGGRYFPTPFSAEENGDYRQGWNHCLRAIYQQPVADTVERKKGKWVSIQHMLAKGKWVATCSECGKEHVFEGTLPNFCSNCGVDMRDKSQNASICSKSDCDYFRKIKPTNADHIRAMTDEEIAYFLSQLADCCICKAEYGEGCSQGKKCEDFWLSWAKQEAKDGEYI